MNGFIGGSMVDCLMDAGGVMLMPDALCVRRRGGGGVLMPKAIPKSL